jgi:hypothetical protein
MARPRHHTLYSSALDNRAIGGNTSLVPFPKCVPEPLALGTPATRSVLASRISRGHSSGRTRIHRGNKQVGVVVLTMIRRGTE